MQNTNNRRLRDDDLDAPPRNVRLPQIARPLQGAGAALFGPLAAVPPLHPGALLHLLGGIPNGAGADEVTAGAGAGGAPNGTGGIPNGAGAGAGVVTAGAIAGGIPNGAGVVTAGAIAGGAPNGAGAGAGGVAAGAIAGGAPNGAGAGAGTDNQRSQSPTNTFPINPYPNSFIPSTPPAQNTIAVANQQPNVVVQPTTNQEQLFNADIDSAPPSPV